MSFSLRCPICRAPLETSSQGVFCSAGHSFDRARQGYLNLLPSHKKRSASPGDSPEMVQARNRFLNTGLYQAPAQALIQQASTYLSSTLSSTLCNTSNPVIVDAGCGEGYYTAGLKQALPESQVVGFDISRPAVQSCCRRDKSIQWLVASVADIPLPDNSADLIVSVFSRIDWAEFTRLLKPGGHVLVLGPGPEHLLELREAIYEDVRPYPEDKLLSLLPETVSLVNKLPVNDRLEVNSSQTLMDLLAMTPHYWHIKPAQRSSLEQREHLHCRLDMRLYAFQYLSSSTPGTQS